jgi:hypothetical protein
MKFLHFPDGSRMPWFGSDDDKELVTLQHVLDARVAYAYAFCYRNGIDPETAGIETIMDVRSKPGWISPDLSRN